MIKRIILLVGIGFLALGIGFAIFHLTSNSTRKITFEECEHAGGTAWRVDLYHPDICPACAEYQKCQVEYNDYLEERNEYAVLREVCPMVVPCVECKKENFPFPDKCPEGREKIGGISDAAIWFQCCK